MVLLLSFVSKGFITECNELECKISKIKAMAKELDGD